MAEQTLDRTGFSKPCKYPGRRLRYYEHMPDQVLMWYAEALYIPVPREGFTSYILHVSVEDKSCARKSFYAEFESEESLTAAFDHCVCDDVQRSFSRQMIREYRGCVNTHTVAGHIPWFMEPA